MKAGNMGVIVPCQKIVQQMPLPTTQCVLFKFWFLKQTENKLRQLCAYSQQEVKHLVKGCHLSLTLFVNFSQVEEKCLVWEPHNFVFAFCR